MAGENSIDPASLARPGYVATTPSKPQTYGTNVNDPVITAKANSSSVGTEVQTTGKDFNAFGKNITNFQNFKGNDKNDAMRLTNDAARDVKKAYMQLQHEFPDVVIDFEPMPDPKASGKKREGFFNYQMELKNWKDEAFDKINNAREASTRDGFNQVMANDNQNAAMNAGVTIGATNALGEQFKEEAQDIKDTVQQEGDETRTEVHQEGARTRSAVHREGAATRKAVHQEGAATRAAVHKEGEATREAVHQEGAITRAAVRKEGEATRAAVHQEGEDTRTTVQHEGQLGRDTTMQESARNRAQIQKEADRVIDTLDPIGVQRAIKSIRDMATQAGQDVSEFITSHPEALVPGLGITVGAAGRLFR